MIDYDLCDKNKHMKTMDMVECLFVLMDRDEKLAIRLAKW